MLTTIGPEKGLDGRHSRPVTYIGTFRPWIHVRQAQPGVEQRPLEREAAPDQESHQIASPVRLYVRGLVDELPFLVDPILRDVRPQICARSHDRWLRRASVGDLQDGARLRITHAELQEIESVVTRQDHEVGLHVPPH